MTLRNKSLVIIISISILIITLFNLSARLILVEGFSSLDQQYAQKNMRRADRAITIEKNVLQNTVQDFAVWDDSYAYAIDKNPKFVNTNIVSGIFVRLHINFIVFINKNGQVISSFGYDLNNNRPLPVSPAILSLISAHQAFRNPGIDTQAAGFVVIEDKPILLAYHSILTSKSTGPAHGMMVMGRYLDKGFSDHLADTIQLPVSLELANNADIQAELKIAKKAAGSQAGLLFNSQDDQPATGYLLVDDIFEQPTLVLRAVIERDIYNYGFKTVVFFINVVLLGSMLFTLAALILIDKNIISRITALSNSVLTLRLKGSLADRVQAEGNDEIGSLASEINKMLQTLQASDQDLRLYKDELEQLVDDRTAKYTQANLDLKREIEEREQGQQALLAAYNEIQMIISSISSIMIGVDDNHRVTLWNNVATRLLGVNKGDAIGQDFFSLAIDWDWMQLASDVDKCTHQNMQVRMNDILLGLPDQNKRILGITLSPLILQDRERPGFLLIGSDITERRRLEEKLDRSSKLEAIGQLAAGVAHEINTPTQLIGSNLRFLGQQIEPVLTLIDRAYALNEDVKNGIATPEAAFHLEDAALAAHINFFRQESPKAIEQSLVGIERITHIVSAMRFFSHPGSETKEVANLNRIIESALSLSRNEWKNLAEIKLDLEPDLPPLECLPIDLSQVVLNLVINAVHAIQDIDSESADFSGRITITSRQVDDLLEMRIIDNGVGIPKEIRNKIFDLFFTTKDVGRGTGQGLAIAYNVVVKKHGGSIEFESEVGKGTTFIIRLPRKAYDD